MSESTARERNKYTKHDQQSGHSHERRDRGEAKMGGKQENLWPIWQGNTGMRSQGKGSP